jgi:hypothetical protein
LARVGDSSLGPTAVGPTNGVQVKRRGIMRFIIIGGGTDAGGWYIGPDGKIHKIPGWNPEQLSNVAHALQGLREIAQIKTPGLAERALVPITDMLQKELAGHLKEGDVLVVGT